MLTQPRFPPKPKLTRLPLVKLMTAIVGLQCTDGVLLLADTEETISQESKSECDKLSMIQCPYGRIVSGGAGTAHFIEYAEQVFEREFLTSNRGWPEVLTDANALMRRIKRDTVGSYKGFPIEMIPESATLLTAINVSGRTLLYRWQDNMALAINPSTHDSIGIGINQTRSLLRDIHIRMGADAMLFYGVRVMNQAKRRVNGVGGKTEAVVLHHDGTLGYFSTGITAQIEELVVDVDAFTNRSLLSLIVDVYSKEEEFEHLLSQVADKIKNFRKSYRELRFRY